MPKEFHFYDIKKANAAFLALDTALNAALEVAKITTIKVEGKDVPASDASLADKLKEVLNVSPVNAGASNLEEVLSSNKIISARADKAEDDLTVANSTITTQTRELSRLNGELTTANGSISRLTAENAEVVRIKKDAVDESARVMKESNATNEQLSKTAIALGCVQLTTADGKALKADADAATKLEAANRIPAGDKIKAIEGAVSSAMARIGVDLKNIPNAAPAAKTGTATHNADGTKKTIDQRSAEHRAKNGK